MESHIATDAHELLPPRLAVLSRIASVQLRKTLPDAQTSPLALPTPSNGIGPGTTEERSIRERASSLQPSHPQDHSYLAISISGGRRRANGHKSVAARVDGSAIEQPEWR